MIDRKPGEVVDYNGVRLLVVMHDRCHGCYFSNIDCDSCRDIIGNCGSVYRMDNTGVIFVPVENL